MKLVEEIIHHVCGEFKISREELFEMGQSHENFLLLIAMSLSCELLEAPAEDIAAAFGESSSKRVTTAYGKLRKYFEHIPGLAKRYEKLRLQIIRRVYGFRET